jgi:hypothetical protein
MSEAESLVAIYVSLMLQSGQKCGSDWAETLGVYPF